MEAFPSKTRETDVSSGFSKRHTWDLLIFKTFTQPPSQLPSFRSDRLTVENPTRSFLTSLGYRLGLERETVNVNSLQLVTLPTSLPVFSGFLRKHSVLE